MLCARLYPYVGESCKKTILDTFRNWKLKSGKQEMDFYCTLVESKILNPDKEAEQEKNEPVLWLLDFEKYDYELFEIDWIKLCPSGLLKEISKISPVRKKISEKFIAAYYAGQVDQSLLDIYFRYFADTYEENGEP